MRQHGISSISGHCESPGRSTGTQMCFINLLFQLRIIDEEWRIWNAHNLHDTKHEKNYIEMLTVSYGP